MVPSPAESMSVLSSAASRSNTHKSRSICSKRAASCLHPYTATRMLACPLRYTLYRLSRQPASAPFSGAPPVALLNTCCPRVLPPATLSEPTFCHRERQNLPTPAAPEFSSYRSHCQAGKKIQGISDQALSKPLPCDLNTDKHEKKDDEEGRKEGKKESLQDRGTSKRDAAGHTPEGRTGKCPRTGRGRSA